MRRRAVVLVVLLAVPGLASAQPWAGIIDPQRATDWRSAGAVIVDRSAAPVCASIAPYTGAATTINNAIAACPSGQVVQLQAGTFTLSSGINFSKSNISVRGAGASSTKLFINNTVGGCHLFFQTAIQMCAGSGNIGVDSPDHTANWTSGYSRATTVVTLNNVTGLAVGSTIFLDQLNDSADGWPAAGNIDVCESSLPCASEGGGGAYARPGRSQIHVANVTAINGTSVTIDPPIAAPNFRSGQSPGAWWGNTGIVLKNAGLEDLTVDFTGGQGGGLQIVNVSNSWVKGTRFIYTASAGSFVFHIMTVNAFRVTIKDNYTYGPNGPVAITNYQFAPHCSGSLLYENNILHHVISGMVPNGPVVNSVFAYNYVDDSFYTGPGVILHGITLHNLYEGNNMSGWFSDVIHGTHHFGTIFRNHLDGFAHNPNANIETALQLQSKSRFFNLIGNVSGHSHWTTYETALADGPDSIYSVGWGGSSSAGPAANDPSVRQTLMRWGNWDSVTSTNDNGSNDATGTRFTAGDVPSGIANFANPVPAGQTLPASFYLNSIPAAWWRTPWGQPPWPAIGPDVSGSNITTATGGHANKIPARLCFENTPVDPAYPSSNPRIRLFNRSTCYIPVGSTPPSTPNGLVVTP